MNTHDAIMSFGKYEGQRVTRVPVGYLKWAVANQAASPIETKDGTFPFHEVARAEITRRGERLENIDVSMHAVDRASLYFMPIFRLEHGHNEGLASWIGRLSWEAWQSRKPEEKCEGDTWKITRGRITFVIEEMLIPVVKTVESA